jgi:hypothetical protein
MKNFINCLPYMFSQYDIWFYSQTLIFLAIVIYLFVLVLRKKNIDIITFSIFLFVIFHYTFTVIPNRTQYRTEIIKFTKRDIIPHTEYNYGLFTPFYLFVQGTENGHNEKIEMDSQYLGEYRGTTVFRSDEVQLKFYRKETI